MKCHYEEREPVRNISPQPGVVSALSQAVIRLLLIFFIGLISS